MKEDALWLSQGVQIDEVEALRIVVEECQSRAAAKLVAPFSEEELSSIRETIGNNASPVTLALASRGKDAADIQAKFNTEDSRRERIFSTYLSERRHFLKSVELLLSAFMNSAKAVPEAGKGKSVSPTATWIENCGQALTTAIGEFDGFILQCFEALATTTQNIDTESALPALGIEWIRTQLTEATHMTEIVFQVIAFREDLASSDVVLGWLRLLQSCYFLDGFNMVCML